MKQSAFAVKTRVGASFEDVLDRLPAVLQREGFGVLTEIDVQGTLKKKLGVDFRKYRILGACNPPSAHRVLQSDLDIGVLLPCNVVVYEDDGGAVVAAIDPMAAIAGVSDDPDVKAVAADIRSRLQRVVDAIGATATNG
jgi:uncharacterized protein (DUF302 family)